MAGIILSWAGTKALNRLELLLRESGGQTSFEDATRLQLDLVERQLASLIGAASREALIYLREGDVEHCRQKLIQAMAQDDADLSAAALYCALLRNANPALALNYYEGIMRKFGAHNIVPSGLLELLQAYVDRSCQMTASEIVLTPDERDDGYYPTAVYCSAWSIVVLWEPQRPNWFYRLIGMHNPHLFVYDWAGHVIFDVQRDGLSVAAVTGDYVVIQSGHERTEAWCVSRKRPIPTRFTNDEAVKLFKTDMPVTLNTGLRWPTRLAVTFGNVAIKIETRDYTLWSDGPESSYGGKTVTRLIPCTGGKLVLTRQLALESNVKSIDGGEG